ncbi:hypothetical protein V6N13_110579 [Hibiscus sabdariffa]|uniref:Uncharacterized protein n=1 Tax=Hibiscus sabdariffa TaxID=183260 RepID=A0ABR2THN6_9ROSI
MEANWEDLWAFEEDPCPEDFNDTENFFSAGMTLDVAKGENSGFKSHHSLNTAGKSLNQVGAKERVAANSPSLHSSGSFETLRQNGHAQ